MCPLHRRTGCAELSSRPFHPHPQPPSTKQQVPPLEMLQEPLAGTPEQIKKAQEGPGQEDRNAPPSEQPDGEMTAFPGEHSGDQNRPQPSFLPAVLIQVQGGAEGKWDRKVLRTIFQPSACVPPPRIPRISLPVAVKERSNESVPALGCVYKLPPRRRQSAACVWEAGVCGDKRSGFSSFAEDALLHQCSCSSLHPQNPPRTLLLRG
ncbi:unnamed protein product [Rangifer tarandus platyrhynchus]|uniref:Uncharacterized protein n=1 Tax=Rangifer tarandus platyrhynchus TaxID=3082113 RepID=A0ABN8ZDP9_RANTA|nr:unnamed protein product [Rangifer tarandus platyrhynchus]